MKKVIKRIVALLLAALVGAVVGKLLRPKSAAAPAVIEAPAAKADDKEPEGKGQTDDDQGELPLFMAGYLDNGNGLVMVYLSDGRELRLGDDGLTAAGPRWCVIDGKRLAFQGRDFWQRREIYKRWVSGEEFREVEEPAATPLPSPATAETGRQDPDAVGSRLGGSAPG